MGCQCYLNTKHLFFRQSLCIKVTGLVGALLLNPINVITVFIGSIYILRDGQNITKRVGIKINTRAKSFIIVTNPSHFVFFSSIKRKNAQFAQQQFNLLLQWKCRANTRETIHFIFLFAIKIRILFKQRLCLNSVFHPFKQLLTQVVLFAFICILFL